MVFSSLIFILCFLPVFLIAYYITPNKYKNIILLLGSLFFYAYGEPKYIFLLLGSIVLNYVVGRFVGPKENEIKPSIGRRLFCCLAVMINLAILVIFKWAPEGISLPLGVSFYTFQSISYILDVYRGDIEGEKSFLKLGCYISMFPQLVAGPIVNYSEVQERLNNPKVSKYLFDQGLKDFTVGLSVKILFADRLSVFWNDLATVGYDSIATPLAWMGAISYSLQLYYDFFGYSLMAIGLGKMLGFELPKNFDIPYTSKSIREFYRRWHMTLGRFFSKYVYIPMGGSKKGLVRTLFNLFVVWILTSLWHGVSLNFLMWGMLLCLFIMIEKIIGIAYRNRTDNKTENKAIKVIGNIISHIYVLFVIIISWVCFAISDLSNLYAYLGRMLGFVKGTLVNGQYLIVECQKYGLTLVIAIAMATGLSKFLYQRFKDTIVGNVVLTVLFWWCIYYVMVMGNNPFMYFRF